MAKEFWDQRYNGIEYAYGTEPNSYFKAFIDTHSAGKILLPGEGEGRNAVYAALKGWEVTAIDQSAEGQKKARLLADQNNVTIEYKIQNLVDIGSENGIYDAVAMVFLHLPPEIRKTIHHNLIKQLKPGGFLLVEAFSKKQYGRHTGGPPVLEMLYDEQILRSDFVEMDIIELLSLTEICDEGLYHQGESALIRMMAQKGSGKEKSFFNSFSS